MAKKVQAYIKINVKAGQANPSPPIGPALGQHGVNIMDFCKSFNEKTRSIDQGSPVPVVITVYSDRSFSFVLKTPPTSFLLKKAAKLKSGSSNTGKETVGTLTRDQIAEIAKIKKIDLTAKSLSSAISSIEGSALSMGLLIEDKKVID